MQTYRHVHCNTSHLDWGRWQSNNKSNRVSGMQAMCSCHSWRRPHEFSQALVKANLTTAPCSNAAKTRNPLKFTGVPQTRQQISAASGPKFTVLSEGVREILLFNKFFPIVDIRLRCEDIVRQSCTMVPRWRKFGDFLGPAFSASHVQHISDMHSKFALRPHHVWKYGRHPISDR